MNIKECTIAYVNSETVMDSGVNFFATTFRELAAFNEARKRFLSAVNNGGMHEDWEKGARLFSFAHAKLARTPCRPSWLLNELLNNQGGEDILERLRTRASNVDPIIRDTFHELENGFRDLSKLGESPLLAQVRKAVPTDSKTVYVLRDLKLWQEVEKCLGDIISRDLFELVKPSSLREHQQAERLCIFGPPWYLNYRNEQYLLRAPAAPKVSMIGCAHEFQGRIMISGLSDKLHISPSPSPTEQENDNLSNFEPFTTIQTGQLRFKDSGGSRAWETGKLVEAWSFKLGSSFGTFFNCESKVWIVLVQNIKGVPTCTGVEKIDVEDLEPGHLILMTTHGGGDMIPVVADMILPHSKQIRELQMNWKERLLTEIEEYGMDQVCACLKRYGATKATIPNVRNWTNPRSLGMENLDSDLKAVLKLVGLDAMHKKIKDSIVALRGAHQSAGAQLQKRLRESLADMKLSEVFKEGFMEIKHGNGPAKTIFLIEERGAPEDVPVEWEGEIRELDE